VSLATAKYFKDGGESPFQFKLEAGWQEISRGLGLVVLGYTILVVGATIGPLFIWLSLNGESLLDRLGAGREEMDALLLLGVLTVALTAILSYSIVLIGHWRCLMYAPERQNAKELMYLCINSVFLASILNVAAVWLDGGRTYAALQGGLGEVMKLGPRSAGVLLQVGSAGLGLFSSLIFSLFLRTVANCFNDQVRVRNVDFNLAFVGLLLGGSVGTLLYMRTLAVQAEVVPWLAGGWLLCFAWHLILVRSVRRCVNDRLGQSKVVRILPAPKSASGVLPIHSLSGLRRLASKKAEG